MGGKYYFSSSYYTLLNELIVISQLNPKSCLNIQHCQPYKAQICLVDKYSGFVVLLLRKIMILSNILCSGCAEKYIHTHFYTFPPCEKSLTCYHVTVVWYGENGKKLKPYHLLGVAFFAISMWKGAIMQCFLWFWSIFHRLRRILKQHYFNWFDL